MKERGLTGCYLVEGINEFSWMAEDVQMFSMISSQMIFTLPGVRGNKCKQTDNCFCMFIYIYIYNER